MDIKEQRRRCIGCVHPFITVMLVAWSGTMPEAVSYVSATRHSIFIQLVSFSPYQFHLRCGATLPWILWKAFLRGQVRGPDGGRPSQLATHILLLWSPVPSLTALYIFMDFTVPLCHIGILCSLTSLQSTPFRVVYGREPLTLLHYVPGTAKVTAIDRQLQEHDQFLAEIRQHLLLAQSTMKRHSDQKCRDLSFVVRDWVWLRLHHRTATAIKSSRYSKLGPWFYGPYQVTERLGEVAYRLHLPDKAKIHDVFHVALLKKFEGTPPSTVAPLLLMHHGCVLPQP
ncbi:LOW QUALITY PROTEIN: hypothetical protein U9M48_019564 [Paspalum notatum var. saurae]|uniref:Tf2-1-like SH3-like domain-containing protein n=1 Tax=Paspalum notatum var. saurae TaxID=547442 RepID=A0AAQ3TCZ7_PASNO